MNLSVKIPNTAQIELWNGRGGEIWTRLQTRLDQLFEPLTAALLTAAHPAKGESVLEIGCGCGDLTLALAKACGAGGAMQAIDISVPMLARAKDREALARAAAPDLAPIEWLHADAMLQAFEPKADLVISRFGCMFFEDPLTAFVNIRGALKPGGRLALLTWAALDHNPWIAAPLQAVHELIEPPPPLAPGAPGPFAFADVTHVQTILGKAGFSHLKAHYIETPLTLGRAGAAAADWAEAAAEDALVLALESGPVAALLREADAGLHQKVRDRLKLTLRQHADPARKEIALAAGCWLYEAHTA